MICLKNIFEVYSSSLPYFWTYQRSSPPYRYYMMMATCMFFNVRQLYTLTMLSCFNDLRVYAQTNIPSISEVEPTLSVLIIFMANCSPVCLCLASKTCPKPPSPSFLMVSYYPKQLAGLKSSPFDAQSTDLFFTNSRSSSKYSAPSELNKRR